MARLSLPRMGDGLIRLLCTTHADGSETIQSVVARISDVDWPVNRDIALEAASDGRQAVEAEPAGPPDRLSGSRLGG